MVMVGGSGYFLGPFLGAAVSVLLPEWMRFGSEGLYLILYAIAVMVLMAFCPSGVLGLVERARRKFG
jgi:branched-chain amino acid transport system permease protein